MQSSSVNLSGLVVALVVCLLVGCLPVRKQAVSEQSPAPGGVVVEEVAEGSALQKAGLQAGDVLRSWERLPNPLAPPRATRGKIESVFDWSWLTIEEGPRSTVELTGERDGERKVFQVTPGKWDAKVRPVLPEDLLASYVRERELIVAGELSESTIYWRKAMTTSKLEDWRLWCGLLLRIGGTWEEIREWEKAQAEYRVALEMARDPIARAVIWDAIGSSYRRQNNYEEADASFRAALDFRKQQAPESLSVALDLDLLGLVAWRRGDLVQATELNRRALAIREELAPGSLAVARSLNGLGAVIAERGELAQAAKLHHQALEIWEKLAPESPGMAASLNDLGALAWDHGDLNQAYEYFQRSLTIHMKQNPESLDIAATLNNLGMLADFRGDMAQAAEHLHQALAIREKLAPESLYVARSLNALGTLAQRRGDMNLAMELYSRALAIKEKLAPESLTLAWSLSSLGSVSLEHGNLAQAVEFHLRALAILRKLAPESRAMARSLRSLGVLARLRGDLNQAADFHQRALAIREKQAPESLAMALSLNSLGVLEWARGDPAQAEELQQRALAIWEELAPGSSEEAEILATLAALYRHTGRPQKSLAYSLRAIDTLEVQISRLGTSEKTKADFRARHGMKYRNAIELLLEQNLLREAFDLHERSRARSFLALLAERELAFDADIPEELDKTRRRLAFFYDRTFHQMMGLSKRQDREKIDALTKKLQELRRQYDENVAAIRLASPKLAALQYPKPLDLQAAQQALDPGTLMLSFSVGEETTDIFVVSREEKLRVENLAIGEGTLKREVEDFTVLLREIKSTGNPRTRALVHNAERLYKTLIEPLEDRIRKSERLLIIPDGPLHRLPFAALIRETAKEASAQGRAWQYLVEWKPLHFVLSATVYAELRKSREKPADTSSSEIPAISVAAFGDPFYPQKLRGHGELDRSLDVYVRSAAQRGFDFPSLPYTRREVEQIAALFRPTTRAYLDEEATEEHAKALGKDTQIVHFAVHGYLDDRDPLESGLAFTIPEEFSEGQDNGLLQVWEIFERMRLDAELVVLSACNSGLGEEQDGEGLIGLTRAFQYAGARSVAATLWNVDDRSTAELMTRFYRHLKAGKSKDEALRAAQIELIRGPIQVTDKAGRIVEHDASVPYFWAAFQIIGDWH